MKKIISVILVLILLFSFFGCNTVPQENKPDGSSSSSSQSTTPAKAPEKELPEKPKDAKAEPLKALEYYMAANEISEELSSMSERADKIDVALGYNGRFEPTDVILYIFVEDKTPIGIFPLQVKETQFLEYGEYDRNSTREDALESMIKCYAAHNGEFDAIGILYGVIGSYNDIFGKSKENEPMILWHFDELDDFSGVDREVYSYEDYLVARVEYEENKNNIIASIPVYPLEDRTFSYTECENWYHLSDGWLGPRGYDYLIGCPIVSENDEYNAYMNILLYKGNVLYSERLVGELKEPKKNEYHGYYEDKVEIFTSYGEKLDESYQEFTDSLYLAAIEDFKKANPDTEIKCVSFDGQSFKVIAAE